MTKDTIKCAALLAAAISLLSTTISNGKAPETPAAIELRGYGKVSAEFGKNRVVFHCQDPESADILLGKLTADLTWDGQEKLKAVDLKIKGKSIPAIKYDPYGVMVLGASGNDVFAFGAPDADSMKVLLGGTPMLKDAARFKPAKPYPLYLDFYDLKAFKCYVSAARSLCGEGIASHWEFVKRLGLGGLTCQSLTVVLNNPAPGVVDFSRMDYEISEAERQGGLFVVCPDVGGELPLWMYNKEPGNSAKFPPSFLYQGWSHGSIGATYESDGGSGAGPLSALRLMMQRYLKSPSLGGWHLYRGQPIGDNLSVNMGGCAGDSSPTAQTSIRKWLKETKGYDLATLGQRWFGDPKHFRSWDEVQVPDTASLVGGGYDPDRFLLPSSWQYRKATEADVGKPPAENGAPWVPVQGPPSQQRAFLPPGFGYFKISFKADEWLKSHAGRPVKLGCTVNLYDNNKLYFWLNGHAFESEPAHSAGFVPIVTDIPAEALNASGENELIIQTPGGRTDGRIGGPVFLSVIPRQIMPFKDKTNNARFSDAYEFQLDSIFARQDEMLKEARRIDPNRPIILSGLIWENCGKFAPLASKYGIGIQYTARDGFYNPWDPALGNIVGFYSTSEPSGTTDTPDKFNKVLSLMLYDGDSSYDAFIDVESYIKLDRECGMFTNKRRLIQLFGKSLRQKPQLLLLRSSLSLSNSSDEPWNWDVGRGEIQAAHYDYGCVSESQIKDGTADPYPVIFDAGSDIMDGETIEALRRYVENGGTFVALHNTGRSDPLEPNTWPISKLTGFKVASSGKRGNIRFTNELPVFKGWEGRQFKAQGIALDWKKNDVADGTGIVLSSEDPESKALALWEDGSIAVGMRTIGKGRVIVLGASFWRDGQDINGRWVPYGTNVFFDRLLTDLGVSKEADASSNRVWVRKTTTKNGLQDWLIAINANERGNNAENAEVTSDLSLKVDSVPDSVIDMVTGAPVDFKTRPGGWVDIPSVKFAKYDTRIFAVNRAGTVADAIPAWWAEKLKYWKKSPDELANVSTPPNDSADAPEAIPFDKWSFQTDPEGAISKAGAWTQPGFDDKAWKTIPSGSWKLLDPELKAYDGIGLYRKDFTIPAAWKGHVITLNLLDYAACEKGEFSINGVKVYEFKVGSFQRAQGIHPNLNFDITKLLHLDGPNTLSVKVEGGKELAGVCGAVWVAPERVLSPSMDLNGTWSCVMKDFVTAKDVSIPGKIFGRYLKREVDIPADWAGRQIFLHLETPANWCGAIMVNGFPKLLTASVRPFGARLEINLTPFLKPGQRNLVELWPGATIPVNYRGVAWNLPDEFQMQVNAVSIGCEVK